MRDLHVTLIQTKLSWENIPANLDMFSRKLDAVPANTDLIILPEMFTTGFSMQSEKLAEDMNGSAVQWMKRKAEEKKAVLTGSFICRDGKRFFNRLVWMNPDGTFETYDKRHLFRMGNEQNHYSAGNKKCVVSLHGWKISLMICYDLRFPVWCRNVNEAFDLQVFVANWPERRSFAWKTLLQARAIENIAFVAGVNRVGEDGHGVTHSGDSAILNFKGESLTTIPPHQEEIQTAVLNYNTLAGFRKQFPAASDADEFTLKI